MAFMLHEWIDWVTRLATAQSMEAGQKTALLTCLHSLHHGYFEPQRQLRGRGSDKRSRPLGRSQDVGQEAVICGPANATSTAAASSGVWTKRMKVLVRI